MLKFPAMGRELVVPLFPDPKPEERDVTLRVRLVSREMFRTWIYASDRIRTENRAEVRELRRTTSKEDGPLLHEDGYTTEKSAKETDQLMRRVIEEAALELAGIEVDGMPAEDYRDPQKIALILGHVGLLGHAFAAVLGAQNPDRKEIFTEGPRDVGPGGAARAT